MTKVGNPFADEFAIHVIVQSLGMILGVFRDIPSSTRFRWDDLNATLHDIQASATGFLKKLLHLLEDTPNNSLLLLLLTSERVEDLLQSRLRNAVLADVHLGLDVFHQREHLRQLHLVVGTAHLEAGEVVLALHHHHLTSTESPHEVVAQLVKAGLLHTPRTEGLSADEAVALHGGSKTVAGRMRRRHSLSKVCIAECMALVLQLDGGHKLAAAAEDVLHQVLQLVGTGHVQLDVEHEAVAEPRLEVLHTTQTAETTADHDANTRTQSLALLHTENDGRVANHRDSHRQLTLVATTETSCQLVLEVSKIQLLDLLHDDTVQRRLRNALDSTEQLEVFPNTEQIEQGIELRAVSDLAANLNLLRQDVEAAQRSRAVTVDTEESKAFTALQTEREVADSHLATRINLPKSDELDGIFVGVAGGNTIRLLLDVFVNFVVFIIVFVFVDVVLGFRESFGVVEVQSQAHVTGSSEHKIQQFPAHDVPAERIRFAIFAILDAVDVSRDHIQKRASEIEQRREAPQELEHRIDVGSRAKHIQDEGLEHDRVRLRGRVFLEEERQAVCEGTNCETEEDEQENHRRERGGRAAITVLAS
ncbi:hypothetical protein GQ600_6131 [Phytophthora cactorum]|nr:hypothetical protein GQ600_6131 [Phytophthora cactorum]